MHSETNQNTTNQNKKRHHCNIKLIVILAQKKLPPASQLTTQPVVKSKCIEEFPNRKINPKKMFNFENKH